MPGGPRVGLPLWFLPGGTPASPRPQGSPGGGAPALAATGEVGDGWKPGALPARGGGGGGERLQPLPPPPPTDLG